MRSRCVQCQTVPPSDIVTKVSGDQEFTRAWDAMRSDEAIQFAPIEEPTIEPPPDWLVEFLDAVSDFFAPVGSFLGAIWPVLFWVLIALAVAAVIYLIYRLYDPASFRGGSHTEEDTNWTPEAGKALALLDEADRLAADGRFAEATHLLLQRSVGQIVEIRPDLIDPSSTAREIAALPALPDAARGAFGTIAERVEHSLFALRQLGADDWQVARDAYSEFALGYKGARA